MKKTLKYLFILTCSLASVVSCARFDEQSVPEQETKVKMTFTAQIEGDAETRTVLGGKMGDEYRKVLWQPGDSIGVLNNLGYEYMHKFVNIEDEVSEISTFEGETYYGDTYYMFYPYNNGLEARDYDKIEFTIPSMQTYAKESFASNAMPMVAKGSPYSTIQFYSLCGVLALNITGSETVQSISFTGKDANGNPMTIAGDYYVNMNYYDAPEIYTSDYDSPTHLATVTLNCGDGVRLDPSKPTPFYIVLPPATYDSFNIIIATTDGKDGTKGKVMLKESTNPLTIKRANATKTGALTYVANETIDLSTLGTANSYIVTDSGLYSINATVIGNGEFGLIDGEPFHTTESTIEPASAKLIWEDTPGVISGVAPSEGRINFMATGVEGNALIAATDANDNILWSWHIWVTDQPAEQTYVNSTGTYVMLDRNIGAISADRGGTSEEDWKNSIGLNYQWGRKDPFTYEKYTGVYTQLSLNETIENPTYFAYGYDRWTKEWSQDLWSTAQKSIYDPCPVGYRVAVPEVWYGFTKTGESVDRTQNMNISGGFENGWYFYINDVESETAWYPATSYIDYWGGFGYSSYEGYIWSAYNNSDDYSRVLHYRYNSDLNCYLNPYNHIASSVNGFPLRCMKDESATTVVMKIQPAFDVTATSAKVSAIVATQGDITIERVGFVCGTSSYVTLENGKEFKADAKVTSGKFTVALNNLEPLSIYYVRAFAVTKDGKTYYSDKATSITTPSKDGINNLSLGGTANCYIVYPVKGTYVFDLVKGNSSEPVGKVASVDVLWETHNNNSVVTEGSVVSSATFENGKAKFEVPEGAVPGNALIAAMDADGTILWSWHIWVVNFDPVQTQQTYASGAVMMDRNLGAISVKPGTVESYGFFYQWGRKDPFVVPGYMDIAPVDAIVYEYRKSSTDTIENATQHPTIVYDDADWGGVDDLWSSTNVKTIYDPCPAGWKVSDKSAWGDSINRADNSQYGYFHLSPQDATPTAYIPLPGYSEGSDTIINNTSEGHIWLAERGYMISFWVWNSSAWPNSYYGVDRLMGVRCMKMEDEGKPGSGENVEVDDDYEW